MNIILVDHIRKYTEIHSNYKAALVLKSTNLNYTIRIIILRKILATSIFQENNIILIRLLWKNKFINIHHVYS